jgi:transposase
MHCRQGQPNFIEIRITPHGGIRGRCSQCQPPAPGYDRLPERRWQFAPLWGIPTYFQYAPRRVECAEHGLDYVLSCVEAAKRFLATRSGWRWTAGLAGWSKTQSALPVLWNLCTLHGSKT